MSRIGTCTCTPSSNPDPWCDIHAEWDEFESKPALGFVLLFDRWMRDAYQSAARFLTSCEPGTLMGFEDRGSYVHLAVWFPDGTHRRLNTVLEKSAWPPSWHGGKTAA